VVPRPFAREQSISLGASNRVFLGWDRAFLPRVADWLLAEFSTRGERSPDLSQLLVVLPGRRAARRLEELLCERAGPAWIPPRLVTEGGLAEALARGPLPLLTPLETRLAWTAALRALDPASLAQLYGVAPQPDEFGSWLLHGRETAQLFAQLAADGVDFAAVAALAPAPYTERERGRWRALAEAQAHHTELCALLGRQDRALAARAVLARGRFASHQRVVLAGIADLNRNQRELLERQDAPVASLVFAPQALEAGFDAWGALRPEFWAARDLPLGEGGSSWAVADRPSDVARDLERWLGDAQARASRAGSALTAADVSVGVLDLALEPQLTGRLRERGIAAHSASGIPLSRTSPSRFAQAALEFLRGKSFASLAALARHSEVEDLLERDCGFAPGRLPALLDEYYPAHLPHAVGPTWLGAEPQRAALERVHARLLELLGEFAGPARQDAGSWARAWRETLGELWSAAPAEESARWQLEQALTATAEALEECEAWPRETASAFGAGELSGPEFLELFLERLEREQVPDAPQADAVELLGFLELPLDEASHLYLAGFNEGALLQGGRDAFLPESLRSALALPSEDRRLARDVYALSAILASRPCVRAVSARRSAENDPLRPSRLAFFRPAAEVPERVRQFFAIVPTRPAGRRIEDEEAPFRHPVRPVDPPARIRVTGLKLFLESPYQFYLQHVLGLKTRDDRAEDLDGAAFGELAHEVLRDFGAGSHRDLTDEDKIRERLTQILRERERDQFGLPARGAVQMQLAQLEWRLGVFARHQAQRAREGWRIVDVEHTPPPLERTFHGRSVRIEGRVDRLDFHEPTRTWQVIDYKTGESADDPRKARKRGAWCDLQLPLYREMLRARTGSDRVELGYFLLAKGESGSGWRPAPWKEEELAGALETLDALVGRILDRDWEELGEPPREPLFAALEGRGLLAVGVSPSEEPAPDAEAFDENGEGEA
jgi:ATP-dependent helicase/nuclease subunit B